MTEVTLGGLAPRREDLVKATWNYDKGLLSQPELERLRAAATQELVELQERLGFKPLCDGLLAWQDQFRPVVEATRGFEVGGVTRLFETNRFYRQPILHGPPQLDWAKLRAAFAPEPRLRSRGWKAILPSPYWWTRATLDQHFHDEAALGHALAAVLNEAARRLAEAGFGTIQFQEPALFHEKAPDVGLANELFAASVRGVQATTVANFPNGDAAPHQSFLQTIPVDVIGVDFVETLPEKLPPRLQEKRVLAQVVNSQESRVESVQELSDLLSRVEARLRPAELWATHTWDLEFVPAPVALKKLEALGALRSRRKVVA